MKPYILLVSGPSGAGKSTLLTRLFAEFEKDLYFSISSTTREPRMSEIHGKDYFFVTQKEFERDIKEGNFLEYAKVHGNYYGTSLKHTLKALDSGKIVVFDIDVQGFFIAKEKIGEKIVSIFITTKNEAKLKQRLFKRNADKMSDLQKRLDNAKDEMKALKDYDYLIINDDLEKSYKLLRAIFLAQRAKITNQNLNELQKLWEKGD
ncbi:MULTISPECIES: guanylate kinase [unclassified Campylobacter]|uniref:guanylate kinase n=1 Tax=unclassified Campylobacter TaxID=2593542 RepID=UPI001237B41A|nr:MULTISPECIES: guanylate kinase [unclassified Campylobacter]KAA6226372.1 guanylate kinase [Campylobacter sp. LR286c]KAA6226590.1 guanylate kinase [Campylobacter sp. LR185c]KAA6226864.1 guanylate kinase [Campylobacter sp. LR196d]KAA6230301.1 guanylate kinase [Campylobacter sp. LR291e]KAA6233822.1 guanylate kinase [Campylobacter sp. LR264d]